MHLTIADVGHGSAMLLRSDEEVILIDTGGGVSVIRLLQSLGITTVDCVVISHADRDHVGGLIAMLASGKVEVRHVILNSDGDKRSNAWRDLAYDLDRFKREGKVEVTPSLREGDVIPTATAGLEIRAVAPRHRLVQLGVGNYDAGGRRIESNSMSAVLLVSYDEESVALVTGDIDAVGWEHLRDAGLDLKAGILTVPHHGGWGGSKEQTVSMTEEICAQVAPSRVFVSNGRGLHGTPQAEVVAAIRRTAPRARIACTQVSKNCLIDELPRVEFEGPKLFSAGRRSNARCAGTIDLELGVPTTDAVFDEHSLFVNQFSTTALCRVNR